MPRMRLRPNITIWSVSKNDETLRIAISEDSCLFGEKYIIYKQLIDEY